MYFISSQISFHFTFFVLSFLSFLYHSFLPYNEYHYAQHVVVSVDFFFFLTLMTLTETKETTLTQTTVVWDSDCYDPELPEQDNYRVQNVKDVICGYYYVVCKTIKVNVFPLRVKRLMLGELV